MEKRHAASKNLKSIHNNKLICDGDTEVWEENSKFFVKPLDETDRRIHVKSGRKRVVINIKQIPPVLRTLYRAEENSDKEQVSSAGESTIVDNFSSLPSREDKNYTESSSTISSTSVSTNLRKQKRYYQYKDRHIETTSLSTVHSGYISQYNSTAVSNKNDKPCSAYLHSQIAMTCPKIEDCKAFTSQQNKEKPVSTLLNELSTPTASELQNLYNKINYIEEKILEQDMVLRSIHRRFTKSWRDREGASTEPAYNERACCSYIEYSHIPGSSAFQSQPQQSNPGQENFPKIGRHAEKYGRDLTLYDNVTARGRRQSASVPGKRNDTPRHAADRAHQIRHKLNPVRDYRLMDTVHYLAQGEFAPRDDGIKLTPSREAVLSDIIWEDVCRTHWPNTRLARQRRERADRRSDLQNLIDGLLRERVARVERKRRRHYRIVKVNHRHDTVRPLGKIGDIIVASNKHGQHSGEKHCKDIKNRHTSRSPSKIKSQENLTRLRQSRDHDSPGPSHGVRNTPMYCYRADNSKSSLSSHIHRNLNQKYPDVISKSSITSRAPRFVIKKKSSDVKRCDVRNLDHFILLPTLVLRTPSNMKRQRKFNGLYHKILNSQMQTDLKNLTSTDRNASNLCLAKKDIGFNININVSESEEKLLKSEQL